MRYKKYRSEKKYPQFMAEDGQAYINTCSKTSFYYKKGGRTTGPCEENVSVVKIIVRHVEHGIGNGRADVC